MDTNPLAQLPDVFQNLTDPRDSRGVRFPFPVQNLISLPGVLLTRVVIEAFVEPSKDAEPVTVPARVIVREVASFVAVPALPETVVCSG